MIIVEYQFIFSSDRHLENGFRPRELKYLVPNLMYTLFCPKQKEHPIFPHPLSLFGCCIVIGH